MPIVDIMTGMYAAIAVLAALARRQVSGQGEHIDIGMLDVGASFLANQAMNYLISGQRAAAHRQRASEHPAAGRVRRRATATSCSRSATTTSSPGSATCSGGRTSPADERFATNAGRVRNNAILTPLIAELLASRERDHWVRECARVGVPCGPINTVPEVFADEQIKHRGMLIEIAHPVAGAVPQVAVADAVQARAAVARARRRRCSASTPRRFCASSAGRMRRRPPHAEADEK